MAPSGYVDPLNARMASRWALGFDILPLIGVAIGHVPPGLAMRFRLLRSLTSAWTTPVSTRMRK
jgi:hypothetical protein